MREGYGSSQFGLGCLLARRLVETGVPCVEVALNGWDTHFDNFPRVKELAGQVDQPLAFLLSDLKQRGMLDTTLVVWMGEFGRTPKINPRAGRDHYPRAFNALLAGGGIRGGQVIGKTDDAGGTWKIARSTWPICFKRSARAWRSIRGREHRPQRPADQDRRRRPAGLRAVRLALFRRRRLRLARLVWTSPCPSG